MDYIKREDAIELITDKTKRLALSKEADGYGEVEWSAYVVEKREAIAILNALPSADVEEVIRCKDCKYFNLDKWGKVNDIPLIVAHEICDFWGEGCKTDKDGYCSFAEKRGGSNTLQHTQCVESVENALGVEERKTGTWRHYENNLTCSECGDVFYDDIMDYCGDEVPHYCPNCGAKMEEQ